MQFNHLNYTYIFCIIFDTVVKMASWLEALRGLVREMPADLVSASGKVLVKFLYSCEILICW